MWERMDEIFIKIENTRDEINILLNMANLTLLDYIMIKRGSKDYPEGLSMGLLEQIDEQIDIIKQSIDSLNKLKKELLVF